MIPILQSRRVYSTKLQIGHNKRTNNNKVFGRIDKMAKSSYGWFTGFKLHLIFNNQVLPIAVEINKGNRDNIAVSAV